MPRGTPLTQAEIDEVMRAIKKSGGNKQLAAKFLGISRSALYQRLEQAESAPEPSPFATGPHKDVALGTSQGAWTIRSTPDNKYRFAAFSDLHAASKYCRWDVREGLTKQAEDFGAQAILDSGNWIDAEASFNRYDVECVGLDMQVRLLAERYPKTKIPTYAITGADHEGWYIRREGVDVGRYCESVMRDAGHAWTNLGYIEADIILVNANSGKTATLRLMHAGGGSAYALSYKPQKILESFEGGEKPDVTLIGHYHKLECALVRNVFYAQVGCQQDQTPFMRQRSLEAHVGGILLEMEQRPEDGSIFSFRPDMKRYFAQGYYFKSGQANQRWSGHGPIRQVPRAPNVKE